MISQRDTYVAYLERESNFNAGTTANASSNRLTSSLIIKRVHLIGSLIIGAMPCHKGFSLWTGSKTRSAIGIERMHGKWQLRYTEGNGSRFCQASNSENTGCRRMKILVLFSETMALSVLLYLTWIPTAWACINFRPCICNTDTRIVSFSFIENDTRPFSQEKVKINFHLGRRRFVIIVNRISSRHRQLFARINSFKLNHT